jgi:hypothetical protein
MHVTGSAKLHDLMQKNYEEAQCIVKERITGCQRLTLCLDGWTAKGLAYSYLGISASFFDTLSSKPVHAMLNLCTLPHPHTGQAMVDMLDSILRQWDIPSNKVMIIVSDNGANMIKAVKLMREKEEARLQELDRDRNHKNDTNLSRGLRPGQEPSVNEPEVLVSTEHETQQEDDNQDESSNDSGDDGVSSHSSESGDEASEESVSSDILQDLPENVVFRRMPCIAHTLQLVVKKAYQKRYMSVLTKARHIVGQVRKSSVAMEKLVARSGRIVVSDCYSME